MILSSIHPLSEKKTPIKWIPFSQHIHKLIHFRLAKSCNWLWWFDNRNKCILKVLFVIISFCFFFVVSRWFRNTITWANYSDWEREDWHTNWCVNKTEKQNEKREINHSKLINCFPKLLLKVEICDDTCNFIRFSFDNSIISMLRKKLKQKKKQFSFCVPNWIISGSTMQSKITDLGEKFNLKSIFEN